MQNEKQIYPGRQFNPGLPSQVGPKGKSLKKRKRRRRSRLSGTGQWRNFPLEAYITLPISRASLSRLSRTQRLELLPAVKRFQMFCEQQNIQYKTSSYTTVPTPPSEPKEKHIHRVSSFYQINGSPNSLPLNGIELGPKRDGCSTDPLSRRDPGELGRMSPLILPTGSYPTFNRTVGSPSQGPLRNKDWPSGSSQPSTSRTMPGASDELAVDPVVVEWQEDTTKSPKAAWTLFPSPPKSSTGLVPGLSGLEGRMRDLQLEQVDIGQGMQAYIQIALPSPSDERRDCLQ